LAFFGEKRDGRDRRKRIKGIKVDDLLQGKSNNITTVSITAGVTAAAQVMADMKIGILVVMDEHQNFAGMVAEREIVGALGHHGAGAADMSVGDILIRNVTACTPETEMSVVLDTMKEKYMRHVPVIVNGKVRGLISLSDILRYLL
jgi:CBS domain-containing protein